MDLIMVGVRAGAAFLAGAVAFAVTSWIIGAVMSGNRSIEAEPNRETDPPTRQELAWHIAHIRDDIGSILGVLGLSNALLAAVLVLLVIRL